MLLYAGTISPIVCPVDGLTEGRHEKTRRKTGRQKKRAERQQQDKGSTPMFSWWSKGDIIYAKGGRDEGLKTKNKIKERVTQPTQSGGAYHRLGREQPNTAKKQQRL